MKVNSTNPVTLAGVKEILKAREAESELGYEQKQAQEYAEKFAKQDKRKEAEALVDKITEANTKVTREVAVIIVNTCPKYPETVRTIALKDKVELTVEEAEGILKLLK